MFKSWRKFLQAYFMLQYIVEDEGGGNANNANQNVEGDPPSGQSSGNNAPDNSNVPDPKAGPEEIGSLPDWAQSLIGGLRSENAEKRTKANNLETRLGKIEGGLKGLFGDEENDMSPEDQISSLSQANEEAEFNNGILQSAIENGIGADELEYYSYKMNKAFDGLEEGQEFSEDQFAAIVQDVKGRNNSNSGNTSVGNSSKNEPNPNASTGTNLAEFQKMNMGQKSQLYSKNKPLYEQLLAEAKSKNISLL